MNKLILDKIKEYDQLILYRHVNPDLDCLGAQFGLYQWLVDNFPEKDVTLAGDFAFDVVDVFKFHDYKKMETHKQDCLAIVLDTANYDRIDGDLSGVKEIIKIDHHVVVDSFGTINLELFSSSTCEILANLVAGYGMILSKTAARLFYIGIIGDSNRFLYDSTTPATFKSAIALLETGINITEIYDDLYLKDAKDLEIKKYIYNKFQVAGGVAYFILNQEDLDEMGITREKGSDNVNLLAGIRQYKIWAAITQDTINHNYRVSMRSRNLDVRQVAQQFNGGGHKQAAGARVKDLEEVAKLLDMLKELTENE